MQQSQEQDHYAILEASPTASQEEIKKAWRRQIKFFHPDRFQDDPDMRVEAERKTKAVNLAYDILKDPQARVEYDRRRGQGRRAAEPQADPLEPLYNQAVRAFKLGNWQGAADLFARIVAANPSYRMARELLRQAQAKLELEARLGALYDEALRNLARQQWQAAIDRLEEIRQARPGYKDVEARLNDAREGLERPKRAQEAAALVHTATTHMQAQEWDQAIVCLQEALRLVPGDSSAKQLLEEAIQTRQRLRQTEGAYQKATALLSSRKYDQAILLLQDIVRADPDYKDAATLLRQACEERERLHQRRGVRYLTAGLVLAIVLMALVANSAATRHAPPAVVAATATPASRHAPSAVVPSGVTPAGSSPQATNPAVTRAVAPPPTDASTPSPVPKASPGSPGADRVIAFNPGPGANPLVGDPNALLGDANGIEAPSYQGFLQLGSGGSVLLAFTDNTIIDAPGPDLQVHGESAKDDFVLVEVSADGKTWYSFPKLHESTGPLDLADFPLDRAVYVRLTDVQPGTPTGAEIDAIVALHSGPSAGLPALPDAVARTGLTLRQAPRSTAEDGAAVAASQPLTLRSRTRDSTWLEVQALGGAAGWCPVAELGLNISISRLAEAQLSPTPKPIAGSGPVPTAKSTRAPTAAPARWILVADSATDYPGPLSERKWWYLWSNGRNNFSWQDMEWDGPDYCYRPPNDWQMRIRLDSIATDSRGDTAILWKAPQGGTYRFEWDSDALRFYKHLNYYGSQGRGTQLGHSAVIADVIDWELFFWVATEPTSYHVRVYRLAP